MLTYAGQTGRQMTALDLSRVIEDVSLLLETTASKASRVHYELAPGLPALHGDSGQITQIVMNLVANASEALGDDGGRIGIGTRPVRADRSLLDRCYLGDARAEGDYVELSVSDDGEGLEADALEQIFDPFYTTRASSRGLGLAVVLGAVQAHDGAIQIESSHSGTCFRVLFPVGSAQRVEPAPIPERPEATAQPAVEGFLLVVDDDDGAREVTVTTLQRSGFDVLQASSGPQAIALFRRHAGDIAGVILDGTMPGMSGAHVFETLKGIDPEARVMLISGHAQERAAEALLSRGLAGFLHKPYEPDDLLLAIEQLLASG
jgi:CheY-like chemotaxis protein/two-component sensor histidine kinase